MISRRIYLIDGVAVSRQIYTRRQLWGEYTGARYQIVDIKVQKEFSK